MRAQRCAAQQAKGDGDGGMNGGVNRLMRVLTARVAVNRGGSDNMRKAPETAPRSDNFDLRDRSPLHSQVWGWNSGGRCAGQGRGQKRVSPRGGRAARRQAVATDIQ